MLDPSLNEEALFAIASDTQGLTTEIMDDLQIHENAWLELSEWAGEWAHNPKAAPPPPAVPTPDVEVAKKRVWPKVQLKPSRWVSALAVLVVLLAGGAAWSVIANGVGTPAANATQSGEVIDEAQSSQGRILRAGSGSWECGSNGVGVACWGHKDGERKDTENIGELDQKQIVALSVGRDFAAAVDAEGQVWAWGKNDVGQLGTMGDTSGAVEVGRVPLPVQQMVSGVEHTCILSGGDPYCFGSNRVGQIRGVPSAEAFTLTQIVGASDVEELGTSGYNTWAITNSGESLVWGNNRFGQSNADDPAETLPPTVTEYNVSENTK